MATVGVVETGGVRHAGHAKELGVAVEEVFEASFAIVLVFFEIGVKGADHSV